MHKISSLPNGLTLITVDLSYLDSVTTLVEVGAGSRYETKNINGISHFLEHMFFKGSKKYPSAEQISTLIDGVGAVNNAFTHKEFTGYWIKSASKHIELSCDIISSMIKESLLSPEEIEREKGVIVEELRMVRDDPSRFIWDLYESLQFGDQPLGWDLGGSEKTINSFKREDFIKYMESLYSPKNMVLVFAGKLPKNIDSLAKKYFSDLPQRKMHLFKPFQKSKQKSPKINFFFKKTDQANVILGMDGYSRYDKKRYAAGILSSILGEGMSSRLFIQVRERRGLAYHVGCNHGFYKDTGYFTVYAGLKLEKVTDGLQVIVAELKRIRDEKVTEAELKKAKDMIRGRLAIRSESTNFLAEYFGFNFVLDRKIETFEEYLENIDRVSVEDILEVAKELIHPERFNLQVVGPFKEKSVFEKILK
ncbi:MAG: pitrilysin family protein [Candidatus Daviesbacteria bacterium]|nr:pitrilysin family protein [Candidatus Daviesbacteria bacterium]